MTKKLMWEPKILWGKWDESKSGRDFIKLKIINKKVKIGKKNLSEVDFRGCCAKLKGDSAESGKGHKPIIWLKNFV